MVLLDIWFHQNEENGLQVLKKIKATHAHIPVVMMSGHANIEAAIETIKLGAYDFIEKPFRLERLLHLVSKTLEHGSLLHENRRLKRSDTISLEALIGKSPSMLVVKQTIQRVAPTHSRVLITGAAGTGKTHIARMVHTLSNQHNPDRNGRFIALNCMCLTVNDIDALSNSTYLEKDIPITLDRDTFYFDNINDLDLEKQANLIRFLQLKGDCARIIASSSVDLKPLIDQHSFRADLYYRLNVIPIEMPVLSARTQDIPDLVRYFSEDFATKNAMVLKTFSTECLLFLQNYSWPGHIRQLKNAVEWAYIVAQTRDDMVIEECDLPPEITHAVRRDHNVTDFFALPLKSARDAFEIEYLKVQLNRFNWNISKTAQFIEMERSALHRKIKLLEETTGQDLGYESAATAGQIVSFAQYNQAKKANSTQ